MEGKLAAIDRRKTPVTLGHDEARLCEAVLTRAGMGVSDLRSAPLARRIHAVLRTLRVRDPRQAVALVEQSAESHRRALAALLIGHTVAFRDESVFSSIRRFVIPRLAARPRVWSLGCSRGLELLSILLLLEERAIVPSAIRGSDLRPLDPGSDPTLARDLVRDAPSDFAELAARATPEWVRDRVQAIDWRRENVLVAEFDAGWDLILCRNLAIYLEPEAAASLWLRLASALKPGGFLIVGKAERPLVSGLHRCGPCIYQRPQRAGGLHGE
jgi:chemotaxis methyl-accepting protein methylase